MTKKILIVEDNTDCREILVAFLRHAGYEIVEAENGAQALGKAAGELPALIVMDLGLPDISGIEVAALLKQDPKTSGIPIIVHSGWPAETWKDKALEVGAGAYLSKPVSPGVLQLMIEKLTVQAKSPPPPLSQDLPPPSEAAGDRPPEPSRLPPGLRPVEDEVYVLDLGEKTRIAEPERDPSSRFLRDRMKRLYEHLTARHSELAKEIPEFDLSAEANIDKITWDYQWKKEIVTAKRKLQERFKSRE